MLPALAATLRAIIAGYAFHYAITLSLFFALFTDTLLRR